MAKIDFAKIPKFSELPVKPGAPLQSNWGVFGNDDQIGCLNFLTPQGIVEAARWVCALRPRTRSRVMKRTASLCLTTNWIIITPRKEASGTG
jgi:hypothetical protein